MRHVLTFVLLLTLAAGVQAGKDKPLQLIADGEPYYEYVPTDVLVKFRTGTSTAEMLNLVGEVSGKVAHWSDILDYYRVEIPSTKETVEAVRHFRSSSRVEWANFNYLASAMWTPDDEYYSFQWHYPRINMAQAWDITRGSANVIVAVADQGWQFNHPDYVGVQVVSPRDFVENDNDPSSDIDDSHGMHVAGTIVAATNNGTGVAGIAHLCRLMPLKVLDDAQGSGTIQWISDGIAWAGANGAHVLNLSLGFGVSGPPQDPGPPLSTAVNQTAAAGTIICAASGNDGQPYVAYPAAYPVCIAVGSTAFNDAIAPYSNGGTQLDISAPGGNTQQDLNGDGYADGVLSTSRMDNAWAYLFHQGTSMASPHVAGLAALLLSNGLPANQVRDAIQQTAVDLGPAGWDPVFGHGRINAHAALQWQPGGGGGGTVTLLNEAFEGNLEGWTLLENGANGDGWQPLNQASPDCPGGAHSGSDAAFHDDEVNVGAQDDWLITPPIGIPANAVACTLSFWQRNCYVAGYYEYHALLYSTNGQNWNLVTEFDTPQADWQRIAVNATALAGYNVWFAWRYQGTYATEWFIDDVMMTAVVPTAADENPAALPESMTLGEPYPNPFNSTASIPFELSAPGQVELAVYNLLGQKVATLVPGLQYAAGRYEVAWHAADATSGVYLVRLTSGADVQTRKLMLVR